MLDLKRLTSVLGAKKKTIEVFSRESQELVEEVVFGEHLLQLVYGTPLGLRLTAKLLVHRWPSFLSGLYYNSPLSRSKIKPFVEILRIDPSQFEKDLADYRSFNEFFARKLKPGLRPICDDPLSVTSPGDGRLLVFPQIDEDSLSYVKWAPVKLIELFNRDQALVERYRGGAAAGALGLPPLSFSRGGNGRTEPHRSRPSAQCQPLCARREDSSVRAEQKNNLLGGDREARMGAAAGGWSDGRG